MRLIDADALLKSAGIFEAKMAARGCGKSILHLAKVWLFNEVNKAPTIDAVEVVRCKDCIHDNTTDCHLCWIENHTLQFINHDAEFFCGKGERRIRDE